MAQGKAMDWDHFSLTTWVVHTVSASAIAGVVVGLLPIIFALPAFLFYCFQLYENKTVQKWLHRRRARKLASLEAHVAKLKSLQRSHD